MQLQKFQVPNLINGFKLQQNIHINVLRDTVCSRQVINYTLHLVLIMALIVIVNFVPVHSKHSIAYRSF